MIGTVRRIYAALNAFAAHPDPLAAGANRIALVVAGNQPFYPLYLWWLVGGDWPISLLTWLSTPCFALVPTVSRRDARAGKALLVSAGIGNGMVSARAFGAASTVEVFLVPCALIALLAFRARQWRWSAVLLTAVAGAAGLHRCYGTPLGHFSAAAYGHFTRLNAGSAIALSALVCWVLGRARWGSRPDQAVRPSHRTTP